VKRDVISIVEAAYDLERDTRGWLSLLLERTAPYLDRGVGLAATIYRLDAGPEEATVVSRGMDDRTLGALLRASRGDADSHQIVGATVGIETVTERLQRIGFTESEARSHRSFVNLFYPLGVREVLALTAAEPSGRTVLIVAPMPDQRRPPRLQAAMWNRVAVHIGAGARLRGIAPDTRDSDLSVGAEAILSPLGALVYALPAAQRPGHREALRRAALAMDRARSEDRSDEGCALELWQGLVAGRWSLVDRFDSDGRRYIVALRNDPKVSDPRALTHRECQVLAYAAMSHPLKLIAYSLGLSVATVAIHRTRAMRKLGIRSHAEVVNLFKGPPPKGVVEQKT